MELQEKEFFMREALKEAQKAYDQEEVPIGAVVVLNGEIIGRGHNLREKEQDATLHAEIKAIRQANQHLGSWRLEDCELFVTLEPCPMCSGAMILARMKKVVFGAFDPKAGTAGTFMNLLQDSRFNHQVEVEQGILEDECKEILQQFFKGLRERNKKRKQEAKQAQQSE
ncbi:tRNA adenosine(34) deaminase TadA [Granulicatella adiacens ATCC 49175]|uniref:tRNA-specific adenosine deaminase n=1 Tax=Granulicatella adiacens ATCC 49175 TaxID=638301 RepID=C8NIK1_9LACT|nr:tRNA adenosine(34) deaminase TadA [Granulicatella adiacens]EEW36398.1 cytidine and deoxycytidylate deaminase zinc-binding region [Granulicatella adiacens ATCC 49175]UAK93028.1 tRNA adenosine(34) deaminase TadA [Granulicatella adiacens]UWP37985.1 tRNA adenosine(34) deaminase TadA [Granulicatella adiacens ATCC 49175]